MGAGKAVQVHAEHLPGRGPHRLIRGSPSFVRAVNMLPVLARFCQVDSVMAGFVCTQCEHEHQVEVPSHSVRVELPEPACPECGASMNIDENLETYFRFMRFRK